VLEVKILILRFTNDDQPGWVDCELVDAWGKRWLFNVKVPIVTSEDLDQTSHYPQPGGMGCEEIKRWRDDAGREIVTITTERPYDEQSIDGETLFDVLDEQLNHN
jgi:hypothetical protein